MKKLIAADYVKVRKDDSTGRTQTCYALAKIGRTALQSYILALQKTLPLDGPAPSTSAKLRGTTLQSA
jgi:predicted ArsR family transcriptional regulator